MKITLLGTGSPIPDANRAGPATLVEAGGQAFLIDCGRGVLLRTTAAGVPVNTLAAVLLTHLHSDHITDLNDVITTRWVTSLQPNPLAIFGPPGTKQVVDGILESLRSDIGYRLAHHDDLTWSPDPVVTEVSDGLALESGEVRITVAPTDHRPVEPTIAFRIEHDGHSVVLAGDTVPCEGLDRLAAGADALVHTVIRADMIKAIPLPRLQDILDYHSSVEQAAETATRNGVGTLVLTHYVPPMAPGAEDEWRAIAAAHFTGPIELGNDLHTITIA